jgi:hypothetical protein
LTPVSLLHVSNAENKGEQHAKGTHSDVADSQEIVLTSKRIGGGDDETLLALERCDLVVILDQQVVFTGWKIFSDLAPQFTEVGQTSGSHPDDEMSCKRKRVKTGEGYLRSCMSCHWMSIWSLICPLASMFLNL